MKLQISRQHLLSMNKEIQDLIYSGSIFSLFMKSKIEDFQNQNMVRIMSTQEKLIEIFNRCHELDEEKKPVMIDIPTEDGAPPKKEPKLKEFVTKEGYEKERQEYLEQEVEVSI